MTTAAAVPDVAAPELAPERHTAARPRAPLGRVRTVLAEMAMVVALLVLLECLVFFGYFRGDIIPQFDFLGTYNTEAYSWWKDGGFFRPVEWIPYSWGGYPAAVSLQNSSWYLPIGIPAKFFLYDLHLAAAVQALHVAAGALGVYVLARVWRLGRVTATVGLVAGFFAAGFFANAQHVDIVRGYAWAPWLLLAITPAWPWRRWWGVPAAALLFWQASVGVYPGILVAFVYVGAIGVIAWQLLERPRFGDYLRPLAIAGVIAVLLAAPKYVPALGLRGLTSPSGAENSAFNLGILGTVFFPYDGDNLPTDMSMRSYFIPATCVALLALVPWRSSKARVVALMGLTAALLSLPFWPWFDALQALPGMNLSRFRASDFRPFLLLAVVLLALLGLSTAIRADAARRQSAEGAGILDLRRSGGALYLVLLLAVAGLLGWSQNFTTVRWAPAWAVLASAAVAVAFLLRIGSPRWRVAVPDARVVAAGLAALTLISGVNSAYTATRTWRADRVIIENETWERQVDDLIDDRSDPQLAAKQAATPAVRRPARTPLDQRPVQVVSSQRAWNSSYYTGIAAVGGYANLKGNPAFDRSFAAFEGPETVEDSAVFWAEVGIAIENDPADIVPSAEAVRACAATGECGVGVRVEPVEYSPGHLVYRLDTRATTLELNESYYPGWTATACAVDTPSACQPVELALGDAGAIEATVPAGEWDLTLDYATPLRSQSWIAFWVGAGLIGVWVLAAALMACVRAARLRGTNVATSTLGGGIGQRPCIAPHLRA